MAGISLGVASTASRLSAQTIIRADTARSWANEQMSLIKLPLDSFDLENKIANTIRTFGGDTGRLRIAESSLGYLSFDEIATKTDWPDEVILVQDAHWSLERRAKPKLKLIKNVLAVEMGRTGLGEPHASFHKQKSSEGEFWDFHHCTMKGAVIEALSLAWNVSLSDLLSNVTSATDEQKVNGGWAELPNGKQISYDHLTIVRKPKQ